MGRASNSIAKGCLLLAALAAPLACGAPGEAIARPGLLQARDEGLPQTADTAAEVSGRERAPIVQLQQQRPGSSGMPELPALSEPPPIDASQVLLIVIGLLVAVGLAMSRLGRLKETAETTFEPGGERPAVRAKVDAALDAALSAQSGPARVFASGSDGPSLPVKLRPAAPVPGTIKDGRPLAIHDNRPRFGKRH